MRYQGSPLGPMTRFYHYSFASDNCFVVLPVRRPLWPEDRSVTYNTIADWSGHWEPITRHDRLIWDCVPSSSPLTTRRDYGGGILTRLHTGTSASVWIGRVLYSDTPLAADDGKVGWTGAEVNQPALFQGTAHLLERRKRNLASNEISNWIMFYVSAQGFSQICECFPWSNDFCKIRFWGLSPESCCYVHFLLKVFIFWDITPYGPVIISLPAFHNHCCENLKSCNVLRGPNRRALFKTLRVGVNTRFEVLIIPDKEENYTILLSFSR
jgi:hypothetical protein